MPTRRRYLRGVGAGTAALLAGCVTSADGDLDPLAATSLDETARAQFRGGLRNRGYVDATVPGDVTVDWTMPINRGEHTAAKSTPVAVGDGDIVVAGDTGTVRRVSADGTVRWRT